MRKNNPPPVGAPFLLPNGNINRQWLRWFQDVGKLGDLRRSPPDLVYTADQALTTDDYGKIIRFDVDTDLVCTLMTATARDVDGWLTIIKYGSERLDIVPDAATRIEYGSYGGKLYCEETKRRAANVTLQLISTTQWIITSAMGLWRVS